MSFKNDAGKWLTKALFYELTHYQGRKHSIYTLKDEDHVDKKTGKEYKSLKKLFLSCTDPTEYEFASKYLGGWAHWKVLQNASELSDHVAEWREERDVALRSKGIIKLIEQAEEKDSYQAAKYLADKGWDIHTKGRPSKEQINKEVKQQAKVKSVVSNDLERLRKLKNG